MEDIIHVIRVKTQFGGTQKVFYQMEAAARYYVDMLREHGEKQVEMFQFNLDNLVSDALTDIFADPELSEMYKITS